MSMNVLELGIRAIGMVSLKRYLAGVKIGRMEGTKAKCYDCMGGYADGARDCEIESCPLYTWMPYGKVVRKK